MGIIAGNTQHGGRKNRGYAESWTSEQLDGLLSEGWLKEMVADIRAGDEKKKDQLPYICPHYAAFKDNHRAQKDIIPEAFTFMTCVDVDDKALVEQAIQRALEVNEDEYSDWQDQVLRIEYSARRKVHIYIRIPKGMTIEEAQQAFCKEIGVPYDESCITPERFIYVTGKDEEVYRSPHWLETLSDEELEERHEAYLQRGLDVDGRKASPPTPLQRARGVMCSETENSSDIEHQPSNIVEPSARALAAFDETLAMTGLDLVTLNRDGVRHNTLKLLLPTLCQMMAQEELLGVLAQKMPEYSKEQDCLGLVSDFYKKYVDPNRPMNLKQKEVFLKSLKAENYTGGSVLSSRVWPYEPLCNSAETTMQSSLSEIYASPNPPKMPEKLPKLIKLLTKNTPEIYKATVAHAVFPSLGAHMRNTQFLYTDNVLHEATLMNVALAGTGAGKGCIDEPINRIMADIRKRDEENLDRLKEYNDACNRKGLNKDKAQRPDDLVIQEIDADVTHAAFVQRLDEAKGRFVYFKLNEIELFDKLKGTGGQQFVIICQAFDPGNRYGQTRASSQSVNAKVCIRFNWNSAGTIGAVTKYFSKVLTKGPISRINFCTIPEREIGAEQPIYGIYDEQFDEQLRPYIQNLTQPYGIVECKQATQLAKRLIAECAEFSRLSQDRVFENLSFRANVIAWLKACVLYMANGQKWERAIEDFVRWSLHYDLWCKMFYFADDIRREINRGQRTGQRGPRNLLLDLPDEFTLEDAQRVRRQQGLDASVRETNHMIRTWKSRGHCAQSTEHSFIKITKK